METVDMYKKIIEIFSNDYDDYKQIDYKQICINLAKHHPDIFLNIHSLIPEANNYVQTEIIKCYSGTNLVECIKLYRQLTGAELKSAKEQTELILSIAGKWSPKND